MVSFPRKYLPSDRDARGTLPAQSSWAIAKPNYTTTVNHLCSQYATHWRAVGLWLIVCTTTTMIERMCAQMGNLWTWSVIASRPSRHRWIGSVKNLFVLVSRYLNIWFDLKVRSFVVSWHFPLNLIIFVPRKVNVSFSALNRKWNRPANFTLINEPTRLLLQELSHSCGHNR